MKHILVPTDLSVHAKDALNYAINLANQYDECMIHLVHVFSTWGSVNATAKADFYQKHDINTRLSEIINEVNPRLFIGTSIFAKAIEGDTVKTILEYAAILEVDLVVMGTRGAGEVKRFFMGSITSGVLRECNRPVIAVPPGFKYQPVRQIALAVDSKIVNSKDILQPLIALAENLDAKIEVVHVTSPKQMAVIDTGVDHYLNEVPHSFHVAEGNDIIKSLNTFINKRKSGMLAMIRRNHNFFERLVFSSTTDDELFTCPIPLLVMNEVEYR